MYAIGVGNGVDRNELEEIASDSEYVYTSSFRALRAIAPQIRTGICEGKSNSTYEGSVYFFLNWGLRFYGNLRVLRRTSEFFKHIHCTLFRLVSHFYFCASHLMCKGCLVTFCSLNVRVYVSFKTFLVMFKLLMTNINI